jgi:hypothetical protein
MKFLRTILFTQLDEGQLHLREYGPTYSLINELMLCFIIVVFGTKSLQMYKCLHKPNL